jgi:hypothetical protein
MYAFKRHTRNNNNNTNNNANYATVTNSALNPDPNPTRLIMENYVFLYVTCLHLSPRFVVIIQKRVVLSFGSAMSSALRLKPFVFSCLQTC